MPDQNSAFDDLESEFDRASAEVRSALSDLSDIGARVEVLEDNIQELNESEKDSFYASVNDIVHDLPENPSIQQLDNTMSELEQSYRQPVINIIHDTIKQILKEVDLSPEENGIGNIKSRIENSINKKPQVVREEYQSLLERISSINDIQKEVLSRYIESSPLNIFDPESIDGELDRIQKRKTRLNSIEDRIYDEPWFPIEVSKFSEIGRFYYPSIDLDTVESSVSDINEVFYEFAEFDYPLTPAIRGVIVTEINDPSSSVDRTLSSLAERTTKLEDLKEEIKQIERLRSAIQDSELNDNPDVIQQYFDILSDPPDDIEDLVEETESLIESYEEWADESEKKWREAAAVIRAYIEVFDVDGDSLNTKVRSQISADDQTISFLDNPAESWLLLSKAQKWINEQSEDIPENTTQSQEAIDLVQELYDSGEVRLDEYDPETINTVYGTLPLKLVIDE